MNTVNWKFFSPSKTWKILVEKLCDSFVGFGVFTDVSGLSQRSKSLSNFLRLFSVFPHNTGLFSLHLQTIQQRQYCYPRFSNHYFLPIPIWSEVKNSTACIFLSPHVGKPIPERMWAPCSRNTGWSTCAVIWDWQLQGFLLSFPVSEQVCCPSIHFSSFIMVLLPFPILLFSLPVPCLVSCPRHCLPFPSVASSSFLSQFLFACHSPWWDGLIPCSPGFGSSRLVPSLLTLFLPCCRTWAAGSIMLWAIALLQSWLKLWEFPCPCLCLPWTYQEMDLRMHDSSALGRVVLIGL